MKKVIAVIVTYNPDIKQLNLNLERIEKEVNKIIICNNSIYDLEINKKNIEVLNFRENLGIARAQNIGMDKAFQDGGDYIIQFDQDSTMDKGMINKLVLNYETLLRKGYKEGIIGPLEYDRDSLERDKNQKGKEVMNGIYEVDKIISSGTLISKEIYNKSGKLLEEWFIDLVDFEYCWRIKNLGYKIYKDTTVGLAHKIGKGKIKSKLGIKIQLWSPFRQYYEFRNRMYSIKMRHIPLKWKIKTIFVLLGKYIIYPLILEDGKERKIFMKQGIKDFLSNKTGKLNKGKVLR